MDDFKDFFKDLRDRITSPLFGSFLVSWIISNWNLVFIILFNNADTLKKNRFETIYNEFVSQPWQKVTVYPALGSLVYIFAYPWVKNKIKLFHAKKQAQIDADILEATKGYPIPLETYIEQLNAFEKEKKTLSGQITEQIKIREERNLAVSESTQLKTEKSELETINSNLTLQLAEANSMNQVVIEGRWAADVAMYNGVSDLQTWRFSGNILVVDDVQYQIEDVVVNAKGTKIAFRLNRNLFSDVNTFIFTKKGQTWGGQGLEGIREILLKPIPKQ